MSNKIRISLLTTFSLLVFLLAAPAVYAAGFGIGEQGADAMGKASAVTGSVTDPNAVYYNPAGLSFSKGFAATLGANLIFTRNTSFENDSTGATTNAKDGFFFLGQVFASAQVTDWMHVGVGGFTAFGLGAEWPSDWEGRYASIKSEIQSFTINPVISFKLTPKLSIAAGFQVVRGTLYLRLGYLGPDIVARANFGGWGYGGNLGIMYQVVPNKVSLGLSYRSRTKIPLDGSATVNSPTIEILPKTSASSSMTFPDIISLGVNVKPLDTLSIGLDFNYEAWDTWDNTVVKVPGVGTIAEKHKYHGAALFRLGAEYKTPIGLIVRAGVVFEQCAAPQEYLSPSIPDGQHLDFTVGIRPPQLFKWLDVDLGYMLVWVMPSRSVRPIDLEPFLNNPEGRYQAILHLLGFMATVRFGQGDNPAPASEVPPPPAAPLTN